MTVTSRKYFSDWFVANGVNKDWGFDFTILSQDDVIIQVRDGTDNTTIVNHTTDLGFYPADDFGSGTVRYPIVAAALPVGKQVRILREVAYFQPERIGKEGKFLPQTHEKALDRVTILTQQVDNNLDLAVKVQIGATPLTVVADLAENRALIRQGDFLVAGPSVTEVSNAQAYATQAGDSATSAQGSATTATNKANEATASATLAQKFATEAVDTPVLPGLFSAFHWAQKAYDVVAAGIIDLSVTTVKLANGAVTQAKLASNFVSGWSSKDTLADADTFLVSDSAASGVAKASSLANLISSIFNGTRAIANGVFLSESFAWKNARGFKRTHNITGHTANRSTTWPDVDVDLSVVPTLPFTKFYQSTEQTITNGGFLFLAHPFGVFPKLVTVSLICKVAGNGYSVGHELHYYTSAASTGSSDRGISVVTTPAAITIRCGASGIPILTHDNGRTYTLTPDHWRIIARGYA